MAVAALVAGAVGACGTDATAPSLGPSTPTGATDIGGPPVTSAPPPPPGWNPKDVVPQSQQEAQDAVLGYLSRTVQALPVGTVLDATRYGSAGHNSWCEDEPKDPKTAPSRFHTSGDLKLPSGADLDVVVRQVGDIWRSWGWYVYERDGFRKPNEFGYGPDGYRLQIVIAAKPDYPPTLSASSPCFPASIAKDGIAFPVVLPSS